MANFWQVNPASGDYVMLGGSPVQTESLTIPAYYRLKTKREGWLYAPDDQYGSDFHTLRKRKSSQDASLVEAVAARAIQPMVDDGRASSIEVETDLVSRHAVGLKTKVFDARGEEETLNLPQV